MAVVRRRVRSAIGGELSVSLESATGAVTLALTTDTRATVSVELTATEARRVREAARDADAFLARDEGAEREDPVGDRGRSGCDRHRTTRWAAARLRGDADGSRG